jgi:hypothetical protein
MRRAIVFLSVFLLGITTIKAQDSKGPTDPKAQKTYQEGLDWLHKGMPAAAIDSFRKADKQDGGHCEECAKKIIEYGLKTGDFKAADAAAQQLIADAKASSTVRPSKKTRPTASPKPTANSRPRSPRIPMCPMPAITTGFASRT